MHSCVDIYNAIINFYLGLPHMCVVHTVTDLFLVCRLWKDTWWSVGLEDLTMWVDKLRALHDSEGLSVVWQVVISLHRVGDLMILSKFSWVAVRLPTVWESGIVVCLLLLFVLLFTFMFIVVRLFIYADYLFTAVQKTVKWMIHWYVS